MQYILPLQKLNLYHSEDFIFSECNDELSKLLVSGDWGHDPYPEIVMLVAPECAGKTHFCHVMRKQNPSLEIIDDIDLVDEVELFHAFNRYHENNQKALFTCKDYKHFKLPDLKSRLAAIKIVHIEQPDDVMMKLLITKSLIERSIAVSDEVVKYLLARIPRSFAALAKNIELIDKLSIEQKRNISVPFLGSLTFVC